MTIASLVTRLFCNKPGWQTSEFHGSIAGVGAIVTVAQLNQPLLIRVVGMITTAAVVIVYAVLRTWIKLADNRPAATPVQLGKLLESQFPSPAVGGPRTSTGTEPKAPVPAQASRY